MTTRSLSLTWSLSYLNLIQAVEFFVAHPDYSRETKIDALELLGASFANDKDNYDLERCYHYLRLAMLWRYGDPTQVFPKVMQTNYLAFVSNVKFSSRSKRKQSCLSSYSSVWDGQTCAWRIPLCSSVTSVVRDGAKKTVLKKSDIHSLMFDGILETTTKALFCDDQ